jgi:transcriptional regulator with XRE-family HTH domain
MKKKSGSSTFTRSAKKETAKILMPPQKPDAFLRVSTPAEVVSRPSNSRLTELYKTEAFQGEWANDVKFHIAQNLLHLRRYRQMSQSELGGKVGTSQSAVARIESGQENITLDTLQRLVMGLDGRFYVSIHPPECSPLQTVPWWETVTSSIHRPWNLVRVASRRTATTDQVIFGLERDHIASANTNALVGATGLLSSGNTGVWQQVK